MFLAFMAFYRRFRFLRFVTGHGLFRIFIVELIDVVPFNYAAAAEVLVATFIAELATTSAPTTALAVIRHVA
jgi:hypothetical protein